MSGWALVVSACTGPVHQARPVRATIADPAGVPAEGDGVVVEGGLEQAHDLVVALIEAVMLEDEAALTALIAPRVASAGRRGGGATTWTDRRQLVRQMIVAARAARVAPGTPASSVIEPGSLTVAPAARVFDREAMPEELRASDVVVRFRVAADARRALAVIAPSGVGIAVVRPGGSPLLIAR